jgi:hypothetical protein
MDEEKLLELGKYLRETGHTQASIASQLGVSQPYVNALLTGRKAFGKSQAKKWGDLYGLSPSWLLTGEGPMLKEEKEKEEEYELLPRITEDKGRPYYDVDFLGGYGEFADDPASAPVTYMIDYPPYNKEGVFYMNVRGDSMSPEINSGDLVALRPIEAWYDFLLLGKVYAIVTLSGQRTIKRLRRGSDSEHYTLEPINPAYESQEIPKTQIERVFEVLGGIRRYE